jgi:hypothetical protein
MGSVVVCVFTSISIACDELVGVVCVIDRCSCPAVDASVGCDGVVSIDCTVVICCSLSLGVVGEVEIGVVCVDVCGSVEKESAEGLRGHSSAV